MDWAFQDPFVERRIVRCKDCGAEFETTSRNAQPLRSLSPFDGSKAGRALISRQERISAQETMSTSGILGEQTTYEGIVVAILDEGNGAYRIQIVDGRDEFSSTCAGYTQAGIRERAIELEYAYLLRRDGAARKPAYALLWRPIRFGERRGHTQEIKRRRFQVPEFRF
jgi:hypothetical protein